MGKSEAEVQAELRLLAPQRGETLWRNNVGVLRDERGVPVRYGLANETKAMNQRWKSADLIGWRRVVVTPDMVGQTLAVFTSYEVKYEGWRYTGAGRESAQKAWADLVTLAGGYACFWAGLPK